MLTGCRCNQGEGGGLGVAAYYDKNNNSSTLMSYVLVVLYALGLLFIAISLLSLSLTVSTTFKLNLLSMYGVNFEFIRIRLLPSFGTNKSNALQV